MKVHTWRKIPKTWNRQQVLLVAMFEPCGYHAVPCLLDSKCGHRFTYPVTCVYATTQTGIEINQNANSHSA